jgi:hypothetical protein
VIRQHELRLRSFDPQLPSPVDLIHLVHPLEAEADSSLTLDPAIDLALLQPDVIAAADAVAALRQFYVPTTSIPR